MDNFSEIVLLIVLQDTIDKTIDDLMEKEYYSIGMIYSDAGRLVLPLIKYNKKFLT